MATLVGGLEIERHYVEYGFRNTQTGQETWCESQSDAEFDALLYPHAVVIRREVYETIPVVIATSG